MKNLPLITPLLFIFLLANPAWADIVIIANPENPVQSLNEKEVQKIFLGRLRMFPDSNLETQTIDLPEDNPLFVTFYDSIANMNPSKVKRYRAYYLFSGKGRVPVQIDDEHSVIRKVLEEQDAIGYVDANSDLGNAKILFTLKP